ncbi:MULTISPECIES: MBL fold metallo-hydrolase [unclassified Clostridium]|uniref:MBL fold metallo-hydrolase n=1 Tax=unclassified Clostridium TaxID=2614128 RepID=UPI000297C93B|nr:MULTISPECIES: MBL fold metallo-hydrolase [unclassified Clostridium]EKQ58232.1 MAG: metal-dependent hydrolase, beta-lactamase superfamily III [Clostridium sp. Maddingley MBC34-26]
MKELNFLGAGSAFNTKLGNTSAFIKQDNSLLLIDCGGTVFHKLQESKILDGINKIYVVITHTHPDHVGSLGDLIFYSHYILKTNINILFPEEKLIRDFLANIGVSEEMYAIKSLRNINITDDKLGEFYMEFFPASHSDSIPAFGFTLNLDGKIIYYSGDSNIISKEIINKLKNDEIYRIYQDTCGLDYEGNVHLSLRKLCELVPHEFRNKVYCMHLDNNITVSEIEKNGCCVVKCI